MTAQAMTLDDIIRQSDELLNSPNENSATDALRLINHLARIHRAELIRQAAAEAAANPDPRFTSAS